MNTGTAADGSWKNGTERDFYTGMQIIDQAVQAVAAHRRISKLNAALRLDAYRRDLIRRRVFRSGIW